MPKDQTLGITVKKDENIAEWYEQAVIKGDLADFAPIQGCMIIKPTGYGMWELMQQAWNSMIKPLGVKNAYFPMFIPESFWEKEAQHVEGFAPEVAWIEKKPDDQERYSLRPTSEAIINDTFAKWIRSHRDLPLKIHQWANIVRWETKATKLLLRTREFLWHEGHCVFATPQEATDDALLMLNKYVEFCRDELALPLVYGRKAESEKFPGAQTTYTIEAMSPDGKAIQAGTTHDMGHNFAHSFNITYTGEDGQQHPVSTTSWGWSTRLLGSVAIIHGDDKGVVLPPRIAPTQAVIVPIRETEEIMQAVQSIQNIEGIRFSVDHDFDKGVGFRFAQHEIIGTPVRIEIGPKDIEQQQCVIALRHNGEKHKVPLAEVQNKLTELLNQVQQDMYNKANQQLSDMIVHVNTYEEFEQAINQGKMAACFVDGTDQTDEQLKQKTSATPRAIPLEQPNIQDKVCILTGNSAKYFCYYARSY